MHYLSLCCIIKDESNLEEFIIYHTLLGVQHFYIYDNESSFPIKERLNSFFYKHYCTIIDFPGRDKQMVAYNHCVNTYGKNTEWLIILDGDEYILPKVDDNLIDFLKKREEYHAIGINWVMFGTSFHNKKQQGFLVDIYRYCQNSFNRHIKSIIRPKFCNFIYNPHFAYLIDQTKAVDAKGHQIDDFCFNYNYTVDIIQINHYYFKSLEDANERHYRGYADQSPSRALRDETIHNEHNEMVDNTLPDKYLERIQKTHRLTCVNLAIYKALNPDINNLVNEDDLANHIIQHGISDNRPMHIQDKFPEFSREKYREENPHLNHLDDVNLEIYYIITH